MVLQSLERAEFAVSWNDGKSKGKWTREKAEARGGGGAVEHRNVGGGLAGHLTGPEDTALSIILSGDRKPSRCVAQGGLQEDGGTVSV